MKIQPVLLLLASFMLLAASAAAEDITLSCDGGDCKVVRSDRAPTGGGYTKASAPVPGPGPVARPIDNPPVARRYDRTVYPNVPYRRHISNRVHHHNDGCGHHYRPIYRYGYGHYGAYGDHRSRRYSYGGRHYGRSFGHRNHHRDSWTGRRHHRRSHSDRSRGHHRSRHRRTRY